MSKLADELETIAKAIHEGRSEIPWEVTTQQDVAYRDARNALSALRAAERPAGEVVGLSREAFDFLMGAGPLEGHYFSDDHPGMKGRYWWRSVIRHGGHLSPAPAPQSAEVVEVLREMYDAMRRYEMDVDADPPYRHREMMRKSADLLERLTAPQEAPGDMHEVDAVAKAISPHLRQSVDKAGHVARLAIMAMRPFVDAQVKAAIAQARQQAFEEAAKVAKGFADGRSDNHGLVIARTIEALASKQGEG